MAQGTPTADTAAMGVFKEELGALTEETPMEERYDLGMMIVGTGVSISAAAKLVGLSRSRLYTRALSTWTDEEKEEKIKEAEQRILFLALDATETLSARIMDLVDDGAMRPSEAVKALGIVRDTVAKKLEWGTPPPPPPPEEKVPLLAQLLNRVERGETLSLKVGFEREETEIEAEVVESED